MDHKSNFVVLGATGGLGSSLCRRLSDAGHAVFVVGRESGKTEELGGELKGPCCTFEATEADSVANSIQRAAERLGTIDGAAHCVESNGVGDLVAE